MTQIYLVINQMILEVELIKITPEQIRVNNKQVKTIWSAESRFYTPYISSRMNRHGTLYFNTIAEAVDCLIGLTQNSLEKSIKAMHSNQLQLAALAALKDTLNVE